MRRYPDRIEVLYGQKPVEVMPRVRGKGASRIDYRHVIWSLVPKPGAFARGWLVSGPRAIRASLGSPSGLTNVVRLVDTPGKWHIIAMSSAIKNFHLPLPVGLYAELRNTAEANGQPATKLAQQLVKQGLELLRRSERRRQIADYARDVAGTLDDLDPAVEQAGLRSLENGDR